MSHHISARSGSMHRFDKEKLDEIITIALLRRAWLPWQIRGCTGTCRCWRGRAALVVGVSRRPHLVAPKPILMARAAHSRGLLLFSLRTPHVSLSSPGFRTKKDFVGKVPHSSRILCVSAHTSESLLLHTQLSRSFAPCCTASNSNISNTRGWKRHAYARAYYRRHRIYSYALAERHIFSVPKHLDLVSGFD